MQLLLKLIIVTLLLLCLTSCTERRTLHQIGIKNVYLEKSGKYCNLFYKNNAGRYILVADSVVFIQAYDSVFAYSRAILTTYPEMTIVKVNKDETFYKKEVSGHEYEKVFPSFFSSPLRANASLASELYDFVNHHEIIVNEEETISLK